MFKIGIVLIQIVFASSLFAGTTGAIRGVVKNRDDNTPAGGVTVVATSNVLLGERVVMTNEKGQYQLDELPPGKYRVTAIFAEAIGQNDDVTVTVDKTITVNLEFSIAGQGEVYTITEKAPNVDVASSTQGVTIDQGFMSKTPVGRSRDVSEVIGLSGSASQDDYGKSVGGATSAENAIVVDGVNAADPSSGVPGIRLVVDFLDQVDVKEGGYGAEYGRATGGYINAVTKSGSNVFRGSVSSYYRPGFLQALALPVSATAQAIQRRSKLGYYLNTGFEAGGPILKDKLWFHIGFAPEVQQSLFYRKLSPILADAKDPTLPALDKLGNVLLDTVRGEEQRYSSLATSFQYTTKITHLISNTQRHSVTFRGSPVSFKGDVSNPLDLDSPDRSMNGQPGSFSFKSLSGNLVTAIYNFTGEYFNDSLKLEAIAGVHHQQSAYNGLKDSQTRIRSLVMQGDLRNYEKNLPSFCGSVDVDGNPIEGTFNDKEKTPYCQIRNYSVGGFGNYSATKLDRVVQKLALTHLFEGGGLHQVKYGMDFEQLLSRAMKGMTGGQMFEDLWPNPSGDYFRDAQYYIRYQNENRPVEETKSVGMTTNFAFFLQDQWNPTQNFTINAGLRWEGQGFFGVKSPIERDTFDYKFGIYDNWAPRLGAVWDFLNNGRSRAFAHYGRYFQSLSLDINERAFGGEVTRVSMYDRNTCTQDGKPGKFLDPWAVTNPSVQCKAVPGKTSYLGQSEFVSPGIKGEYSDEFILGVDVEPYVDWVLGVSGTYRELGRIVEDISMDGGESYVVTNPGEFDISRLDGLNAEIANETDSDKRALLQKRKSVLAGINSFPRAERKYWSLQFKVDKKISNHFSLLSTYVLSWTWGNYPGSISPTNGQLAPNLSSQFDLPELLVNRRGFLPQDQRHKFKFTGYYSSSLYDYGINIPLLLTLGASLRLQSGSPINVLGAHEVYGAYESFILPQGTGGRTPWTFAVDMNLGLGYDIGNEMGLEFFVALYNVTNSQITTSVDNAYTYDFVNPVQGLDPSQLPNVLNTSGEPVRKNPNYKKPTGFQAPFSMQMGLKFTF